jgi:hypothetical protein
LPRALAFRSVGTIVDSIADCNITLSLEPKCFHALEARASILETNLEHLKFLYNMNLCVRKLFVDLVWKPYNVRYNEILEKIRTITTKVEQLKRKMDNAEEFNVDYYVVMGLPRECDLSELERVYCVLDLRHKPKTTIRFITRELHDEHDV